MTEAEALNRIDGYWYNNSFPQSSNYINYNDRHVKSHNDIDNYKVSKETSIKDPLTGKFVEYEHLHFTRNLKYQGFNLVSKYNSTLNQSLLNKIKESGSVTPEFMPKTNDNLKYDPHKNLNLLLKYDFEYSNYHGYVKNESNQKVNYFINYNGLSKEVNPNIDTKLYLSKIAPDDNENQKIELEKMKTLMKMKYGSKNDVFFDNQSYDSNPLMDDLKIINKIKPDNFINAGMTKYQEDYIENYMEVEEKIKREGLEMGIKLEEKYNIKDLYYFDAMLAEHSKFSPDAVKPDLLINEDFDKNYKYINEDSKRNYRVLQDPPTTMKEAYMNSDSRVIKQKLRRLLLKYRQEHTEESSEGLNIKMDIMDSYMDLPDVAQRDFNSLLYNFEVEILEEMSPEELYVSQNYKDLYPMPFPTNIAYNEFLQCIQTYTWSFYRTILILRDYLKWQDELYKIEQKKYQDMSQQEINEVTAVDIFDRSKRVFLPSILPAYYNLPEKMQKQHAIRATVIAMDTHRPYNSLKEKSELLHKIAQTFVRDPWTIMYERLYEYDDSKVRDAHFNEFIKNYSKYVKEFKKAAEMGEKTDIKDLYSSESLQEVTDRDKQRLEKQVGWYENSNNNDKVNQLKEKIKKLEEKTQQAAKKTQQIQDEVQESNESDMELHRKLVKIKPSFALRLKERPVRKNFPIDYWDNDDGIYDKYLELRKEDWKHYQDEAFPKSINHYNYFNELTDYEIIDHTPAYQEFVRDISSGRYEIPRIQEAENYKTDWDELYNEKNIKRIKYRYTLEKMKRDGKIDFEETDKEIKIP